VDGRYNKRKWIGDTVKYTNIVNGKFIRRVNRFIAEVMVEGFKEQVHIKNTGRLKELLLPEAQVLLEKSQNPNRKTKYSISAVVKHGRWVNIDSQAPNKVAYEAIQAGRVSELGFVSNLTREVTFNSSRFDLYYEKQGEEGFIEVKGVTFEKNGVAMFPDAPTTRGTKHVLELIDALDEGYTATVLFIIQMKGCHTFTPYAEMDPAFTEVLLKAQRKGVRILAYDCLVDEEYIALDQSIPIDLL